MKKIFEKDPSYYRLDLHTGNVLYFSHAIKVKDDEYIDLSVKDIVMKIDELIVKINAIDEITATLAAQRRDADSPEK